MVVQVDPCVLRGVPEFFESNLEECLISRTESLSKCEISGSDMLSHFSGIGAARFMSDY
jgi:hypothetical protein